MSRKIKEVWVTRYALTRGILKGRVVGKAYEDEWSFYVDIPGVSLESHRNGIHAHVDHIKAVARAKQMIQRRRAALLRETERLNEIEAACADEGAQ